MVSVNISGRRDRQRLVLKMLKSCDRLSNKSLAELLAVTQKTVRTDIQQLADSGQIIRVHGGIIKGPEFAAEDESCAASVISNYSKEGNSLQGNVFILGSFNVDIVSRVERFPVAGETLISLGCSYGAGGKGANQAYAAAQSDAAVTFMTKLGKDQFNEFAREHLKNTGIETLILCEAETEPTGNAVIMVQQSNGENMIAIGTGANGVVTQAEINSSASSIAAADVFLTQLENNFDAIERAVKLAKQSQVAVMVNPAPYHPQLNSLLSDIDIITPNETEASLLCGIEVTDRDSAARAARAISAQGVGVVIVTRGAAGALLLADGELHDIPPFSARVKDTTGAGDAFNGAFAAQLAKGRGYYDAALYASAYASLAVEGEGAAHMPAGELAEQRLAKFTTATAASVTA